MAGFWLSFGTINKRFLAQVVLIVFFFNSYYLTGSLFLRGDFFCRGAFIVPGFFWEVAGSEGLLLALKLTFLEVFNKEFSV